MNTLCKTLVTIVALIALFAIMMLVVLGLCVYSKPSCTTIDLPNVILSLIGVCASLIVGVSIYNTVDVSSTLRKTEEKVKVVEEKLAEMEKLSADIRKVKKQSNILFHHTWGMTKEKEQPYSALCEYWKAFELCAISDDYSRGKSCISNALSVVEYIQKSSTTVNNTDRDNIPHELPDSLKETKLYKFYKKEIDKLFNIIKEIV